MRKPKLNRDYVRVEQADEFIVTLPLNPPIGEVFSVMSDKPLRVVSPDNTHFITSVGAHGVTEVMAISKPRRR